MIQSEWARLKFRQYFLHSLHSDLMAQSGEFNFEVRHSPYAA